MGLFVCSNEQCDAVENTGPSNYWSTIRQPPLERRPLCSECDPRIGKWHGIFEKEAVTLERLRKERRQFEWLPRRWLERLGEIKPERGRS